MTDTILKGGISYYEYIWHTEAGACDTCQELDGMTFSNIDEIPDRPHPNCKCWIEVVEKDNFEDNHHRQENKNKKEEELCDCWESIDALEELIGNANALKDKINESIEKFKNLPIKLKDIYENLCQKYLDKASSWDNALGDFARNYNDMVEANTIGADKYFHAKANCQAAQRGLTGETVSKAESLFRELEEGTRKVLFEGEDLIEQIKDAKEDMKANDEGRNLGKKYDTIPCEDLLWEKRPNGLDEKY